MEIYQSLCFKPELQMIIKSHFDKLVLHEKLHKAKAFLEKNFVRTLVDKICHPGIGLYYLTWRVGPGPEDTTVRKLVSFSKSLDSGPWIDLFDFTKRTHARWNEHGLTMNDLNVDQCSGKIGDEVKKIVCLETFV